MGLNAMYRQRAAQDDFMWRFRELLGGKGLIANPNATKIYAAAGDVLSAWQRSNPQVMVSVIAVQDWLNGERLPKWGTVQALADWLDCETGDLVAACFADLRDDFFKNPILEFDGFGFVGAENHAVQVGLTDEGCFLIPA